ncbi:hypothetical protein OAQ99_05225 [Candidatus Kapabacteria bacterium]|nr:hypothetical protein [Candidatus Kapabacteria bacterium]
MRDWYKNNFDRGKGKKRFNKRIYFYLVPVWLACVFFLNKAPKNTDSLPNVQIISKKMTSNFAELDLEDRLTHYKNGNKNITYLVKAQIENTGNDGYVDVKTSFIREDTIANKNIRYYIGANDTILAIIDFTVPLNSDLKRKYKIELKAQKINKNLSINNL